MSVSPRLLWDALPKRDALTVLSATFALAFMHLTTGPFGTWQTLAGIGFGVSMLGFGTLSLGDALGWRWSA